MLFDLNFVILLIFYAWFPTGLVVYNYLENKNIEKLYKFYIIIIHKEKQMKNIKRTRMCVYLDVELSDWIKENAISEYRSFSSFLNKLMLDHKKTIEVQKTINVLRSEIKN